MSRPVVQQMHIAMIFDMCHSLSQLNGIRDRHRMSSEEGKEICPKEIY